MHTGKEKDHLGRWVVTNFSEDRLPIYQQAILFETGLRIDRQAFDTNGRRSEGLYALVSQDWPRDLSRFWRIFEEMERRKNNRIKLWMHIDDFVKKIDAEKPTNSEN